MQEAEKARVEEPGGLHAVYLANRRALLRFLRARGAGESAEDVLQDLWLKLSTSSHGPIADPLAYLYRAANNLMISRHRSAARAQRREDNWRDQANQSAASADRVVIARDEIDRAERRLRALGPRVLRVFVMFRIDGLPQREIAAQLNVSLSTVEKELQRAYRAIAALRDDADAGIDGERRL